MRAIEFERIAGGKPFDTSVPWYIALLRRHRPGLTGWRGAIKKPPEGG